MSQRFELSISPNYVPDWGIVEAVRELFQNALDAEKDCIDNELSWTYDNGKMYIVSPKSSLLKDSLLFGTTTKVNNAKAIGQFGEGYKLALLVLTRLGYKVTVHNNRRGEIWVPKIIKSKRYDSNLLVVDVTKHIPKSKDLTFEIEDVSQLDFEKLQKSNLHIKPLRPLAETYFGQILTRENAGDLFVNGLFVCNTENFKFGYNIKPEHITLGRDRDLVTNFNLSWVTGQIWKEAGLDATLINLLKEDKPVDDVKYVNSFISQNHHITKTMYADFAGTYGKMAIPVSSQAEFDMIKKSYKKLKPILVPAPVREVIYVCTDDLRATAERRVKPGKTPQQKLKALLNKISHLLSRKQLEEFIELIEDSSDWDY
jgi:hypothetical protein